LAQKLQPPSIWTHLKTMTFSPFFKVKGVEESDSGVHSPALLVIGKDVFAVDPDLGVVVAADLDYDALKLFRGFDPGDRVDAGEVDARKSVPMSTTPSGRELETLRQRAKVKGWEPSSFASSGTSGMPRDSVKQTSVVCAGCVS
jgi:hypothetical protein